MPVRFEVRDRIALVTLDRPEAMNAIDSEMLRQLDEAWTRIEEDAELLVAVVTGAGERAFCAGRDIAKSVGDEDGDWSLRAEEMRIGPEGVLKPVIAAVNGHCLAAGLALALACDIRIASTNATFGTMAAKRGIVAGGGQTQRLARFVPFGVALELALTAERISAERALQIGLVNAVVPGEDLMDAALAMARTIASNAPLAVQAMKRAMYEGALELSLSDGLKVERRAYLEVSKSDDAAEGAKAFLEKRPPAFRGS
jgi:enoyl-CoA hydratase/carnithine racemase